MPCPYLTLAVAETATSGEIREAYLRAARAHPPDREPQRFQAIHEAYERIRDEEARARLKLSGLPASELTGPLADLVPGRPGERKSIGSDRWLEAARVRVAERAEAQRAQTSPKDDPASLLDELLSAMQGGRMPGMPMPWDEGDLP